MLVVVVSCLFYLSPYIEFVVKKYIFLVPIFDMVLDSQVFIFSSLDKVFETSGQWTPLHVVQYYY